MRSLREGLAIFERIKSRHAEGLFQKTQLHCETGRWLSSAVLKLQKRTWSDDGMKQGIFFSIWLTQSDLAQNRFHYNIHALQLGSQKVCGVKPVSFARAFRAKFDSKGWPNISLDFGPQTLMQGWLPLQPDKFEPDVASLIHRFASAHHVIDELLMQKPKG